jgi:hypothetical protein
MTDHFDRSPLVTVGVLMIALTFASGCATIINGTTQKIPVSSSPSGAKVSVNESTAITTPTTLELSRKDPQILQFSLEGYQPETVKLESVTSGVVMGNILLGGLIGWGVDAASGGQYRLVPESVHVALRPVTFTDSQRGTVTPVLTQETLESRLKQLADLKDKELITDDEFQTTKKRLLESYSK